MQDLILKDNNYEADLGDGRTIIVPTETFENRLETLACSYIYMRMSPPDADQAEAILANNDEQAQEANTWAFSELKNPALWLDWDNWSTKVKIVKREAE